MPSSCPKCGKPLEVYLLKGIKYLDCSGYPECKYRVELGKINQSIPIVEQNGKVTYPKVCPNCNKRIAIYIGEKGAFFGCNGYPHCRFSFSIESTKNILCPDCGSLMYERTGSRGIFLGCGGYPECKFTYDIRISKNVESTITPVKSQRKKLVSDQLETPITNDKILKILSKDWHAVNQMASKLGVKEANGVNFLILKLKQLERKNLLISKNVNTINYWKTSEKGTLKKRETIFALKLENNKWWIGKSKNPTTAIAKYKYGKGSVWTRENRVIKLEEIIEDGDLTEVMLRYMRNYDWKNVRGTSFNDSYYVYIPKKIKEYIKSQDGGLEYFKEKEEQTGPKNVYILRLENGKWYVGKSSNVKRRIEKLKEKGNTWTQMHNIIALEEVRENADLKDVTLEYMRSYGWENVRGYAWSQWNLKYPPREL